MTVTPVSGAAKPTYQIAGLSPFTAASGNYARTGDAGKIIDYANNMGSGTATVTWT